MVSGVQHRDPGPEPAVVGAPAQLRLGGRQLEAVVDAGGLERVVAHHGADPVAGLGEHGHDVGEVVLALGVVGGDPAQGRRQQRSAEAVDRRVDLGHLELVGRGVALLDDAAHPTVLVAHHPAVARGVVEHGRQHRARRARGPVLVDQRADGGRPQQRRVARQHEHVDAVVVIVVVEGVAEGGEGDRHGVAGAALDRLLDELQRQVAGRVGELLGDPVGPVADDHDGPVDREVAEAVEDVEHHGLAAQDVQRLGAGRAHAGALAGGEHDGAQGGSGRSRSGRRARTSNIRLQRPAFCQLNYPRWRHR